MPEDRENAIMDDSSETDVTINVEGATISQEWSFVPTISNDGRQYLEFCLLLMEMSHVAEL